MSQSTNRSTNRSTTVSITATNRAFRTGFNEDLLFGTWAAASMSLIHNGTSVATWDEMDVDRLLSRLATDLTSPLGNRLTLDLYQARLLHICPEVLAVLTNNDFYLSVVSRDTDQSLHMDYVPLSVFRQAVAAARSSHKTWLASQPPRPTPKRRKV
jgi:hypothetical protein